MILFSQKLKKGPNITTKLTRHDLFLTSLLTSLWHTSRARIESKRIQKYLESNFSRMQRGHRSAFSGAGYIDIAEYL